MKKIGVTLQPRKEKVFNYYLNFDYKGRCDFCVVISVNETLSGFANLTKPHRGTLNFLVKIEGKYPIC